VETENPSACEMVDCKCVNERQRCIACM
jgi:hypothetical protein